MEKPAAAPTEPARHPANLDNLHLMWMRINCSSSPLTSATPVTAGTGVSHGTNLFLDVQIRAQDGNRRMGKHKFLYIFLDIFIFFVGFKRTRSVIIVFYNQSRLKYSLQAQDFLSSLLYLASHRLLIFASF